MITTRKILNGLAFFTVLSVIAGAFIAAFSFGLLSPITGKEAAANAVARTGGYAKEVEFEYDYHTGGHYEVEVLANGLKHDVIVDADNGNVLAIHTKGHKHRYHDGSESFKM
ncbi:PepSY domain-containing protein [Neisseria sp. 83E34]|uniref:PepSY domain-containing protein n=1 Tax=Neisseria sp. 83E34 TaxID=1692264 RepID=UPI0006CE7299|nr:PepSY domain-containing protein [Neisseria sp. 83E34]KPN71377.1 peptidase [Neisseria sp. 83E34]